ncbi:MAG: DoxX family protein [Thermoplasmatota archaeon]
MATALTITLWIAQGILALMFLMAGTPKAKDPAAFKQKSGMGLPPGLVRSIGTAEILGAVGVVFPTLLGVTAWLTPIAALGLVTIMALAIGFHAQRKEWNVIPMNAVLLGLSIFVVVGRWSLF